MPAIVSKQTNPTAPERSLSHVGSPMNARYGRRSRSLVARAARSPAAPPRRGRGALAAVRAQPPPLALADHGALSSSDAGAARTGARAAAPPVARSGAHDVVAHEGPCSLAFRTAQRRFAGDEAELYVVSSTDQERWTLEARVALGRDVREPRLVSGAGRANDHLPDDVDPALTPRSPQPRHRERGRAPRDHWCNSRGCVRVLAGRLHDPRGEAAGGSDSV